MTTSSVRCAVITCTTLTAPTNGAVYSYSNGQNWGSVATTTCNAGFYLSSGLLAATCQGSSQPGSWNISAPTCSGELWCVYRQAVRMLLCIVEHTAAERLF